MGSLWEYAIRLSILFAMAMALTRPAYAQSQSETCQRLAERQGYVVSDYQNAMSLRKTYNEGNFTYGERKQVQDRVDRALSAAKALDDEVIAAHCLDQSSSSSSSSAPYVEPAPKPVPVTKFPDFDPQNPKNQQMMLMCAGTYAFFTSASGDTNPHDKAAYEAMLAAFQKSRGISKSAAADLVNQNKWRIGGSIDFSKIDKNRGIEFQLNSEFGTFEANMAELADQAFLCGNTLGIDKPSLIDKYLSAFYR
jgi:hypothetical protein